MFKILTLEVDMLVKCFHLVALLSSCQKNPIMQVQYLILVIFNYNMLGITAFDNSLVKTITGVNCVVMVSSIL